MKVPTLEPDHREVRERAKVSQQASKRQALVFPPPLAARPALIAALICTLLTSLLSIVSITAPLFGDFALLTQFVAFVCLYVALFRLDDKDQATHARITDLEKRLDDALNPTDL